MTATWKVYSVTSLEVWFEKDAEMWMVDSLFGGLPIVKMIPTWLSETTTLLDAGRSSGKAELKLHSSSAEAPLLGWEGV